jgi:anti-anti-sigma factor
MTGRSFAVPADRDQQIVIPPLEGRPLPYNLRFSRESGHITVYVTGELDIETAPALKDVFDRLVEQGDTTIRVNLRWLTFCDSTGISAFVHGYEACRAAGGHLRITGAQGTVARVLDMTGVLPILGAADPEPAEPEALGRVPMGVDDPTPAEAPGTRSGTLRLEIGVRDEDEPGRSIIAAPSQDDVADALAALDGRRHTELTVVDGGGAYLRVRGGRGRYQVHVGAPDQDESVLQSATGAAVSSGRDVVDLDQASAAVRQFLRTGRPDPDLEWRSTGRRQ